LAILTSTFKPRSLNIADPQCYGLHPSAHGEDNVLEPCDRRPAATCMSRKINAHSLLLSCLRTICTDLQSASNWQLRTQTSVSLSSSTPEAFNSVAKPTTRGCTVTRHPPSCIARSQAKSLYLPLFSRSFREPEAPKCRPPPGWPNVASSTPANRFWCCDDLLGY
jgi:hypothetical protein